MAEKLVSKDKILEMLLDINDQLEVLEETLGIHADKEKEKMWSEGSEIIEKAQKIYGGTGQLLQKISRSASSNTRKPLELGSGLKPLLVRG
ncbi:hypothetical protein JOC77_002034 [Peribacillus deserti]|uniref:Uncharacterized protein n=1 Tax=Peribacillus deserti TaxID=673318 RepID=A0ABS2QHI3_9BACI|nr:hypothetical protein [Peribacillus deserti]MBM7692604.1 hypothetical protein [Peribacillus deserti]